VVTPLFPDEGPFEVIEVPIRHDTVTAVVARRRAAVAGATQVPDDVHAVA
jgi:hypothetical protein